MTFLNIITEFLNKYQSAIILITFFSMFAIILYKIRHILPELFKTMAKWSKRRHYIEKKLFADIVQNNNYQIKDNTANVNAPVVEYHVQAQNLFNGIVLNYVKYYNSKDCFDYFLSIAPEDNHYYTYTNNNKIIFCEAYREDEEKYFHAIYCNDVIIFSEVNIEQSQELDDLFELLLYRQ